MGRYCLGCFMPARLSVRIFPNNECRLRMAPPPASGPRSSSFSHVCSDAQSHLTPVGLPASYSLGGSEQIYSDDSQISPCQGSDSYLDISADFAECAPPPPKPGYGGECKRTKFGRYAKRHLQRIGGVLDTDLNKPSDGWFLTGTIPGSTLEAFNAVADYSSWIVKSLKDWTNDLSEPGAAMDFYVWERQARGALHIHYYFVPSPAIDTKDLPERFRDKWYRILCAVSERSGIDVFDRGDGASWRNNPETLQALAVPVEKSVTAYLSKYCTKDSGATKAFGDALHYPCRWWGVSRYLKRRLSELTLTIDRDYANFSACQSDYQDALATLEAHSITAFRYGDKVGIGLNHVFYYSPEDTLPVMYEISQQLSSSYTNLASSNMNDALRSIVECLNSLKQDARFRQYVRANMSPKGLKVCSLIRAHSPVTSFDCYAIATELEALCVIYTRQAPYIPLVANRVKTRMEGAARVFQGENCVEGLVFEWRDHPPIVPRRLEML